MALFSLTDIKFKKDTGVAKKPIHEDENFRKNILRYPIDIGELDKGHYMIIHVNVQDRTSYKINKAADKYKPTIFSSREGLYNQTGYQNIGGATQDIKQAINYAVDKLSASANEADANKIEPSFGGFLKETVKNAVIDPLSNFGGQVFGNSGIVKNFNDAGIGIAKELSKLGNINNENFVRKIVRTTDSIALYMPDTLNFSHSQTYNSKSPASEIGAIAAAGSSLLKNFENDYQKLGQNLTPFIADRLRSLAGKIVGDNTADLFLYSAFGTLNPKMELIYTSPNFRSFSFEFMFYPRSEEEATQVQDIIQRLKFHQAPEIDTGTAGYFLVPPSEFDIEFYYNGEINPNIPKISTCVLQSINVDYAPNGFVAYESPDSLGVAKYGSTGMPYAIRLRLDFQETEIMTKFNFQNDNQKQSYRRRNDPNVEGPR